MDAFDVSKNDLLDALHYHEQFYHLREVDANVRELVQQCRAEMEAEDMNGSPPTVGGPLQFMATDVENCMDDLEKAAHRDSDGDFEDMIKSLNPDQSGIFSKIKDVVFSQISPNKEGPPPECLLLAVERWERVF